METPVRRTAWLAVIAILASILSCAPVPKIWTSEPVSGISSNPYFRAKLEPLKQGRPFYVSFLLEVENRTQEDMAIDWNKTLYLHNGKEKGIFLFKGVRPEDVKNRSIPPDIIAPGQTLTKVIAPHRLLARASLRDRSESKGIHAGILPEGENGVELVVRYMGKELVETMRVTLRETPGS